MKERIDTTMMQDANENSSFTTSTTSHKAIRKSGCSTPTVANNC